MSLRYLVSWRPAGRTRAPATPPAGRRSWQPRPQNCVLVGELHPQALGCPAALEENVAREGGSVPGKPRPQRQDGWPPQTQGGPSLQPRRNAEQDGTLTEGPRQPAHPE